MVSRRQPGGRSAAAAELSFGTAPRDGETARFEGHRNGAVSALDYAPDGSRIVTAGTDGSVRVWDAETEARNSTNLPEDRAPGSRPGPPRRPRRAGVAFTPAADAF